MAKLLGAVLLCVLATVFVIQNADHVMLQLLVGEPIRVRLIFLLMSFFILGYAVCFIFGLKREYKLKRKIKTLQALRAPVPQATRDDFREGFEGH